MMFDEKITEQLKSFVHADESERNYEEAALLLLKVSGNKVEYKNNLANLDSKKQHIAKRLSQYLEFRLKALTREQVSQMSQKAEKIVKEIPATEQRYAIGKREDHDSLPDEIQACYKECHNIMKLQQQLHMKLRSLVLTDAPCPDSEVFPFVKEIIELDKKRLSNWKKYDNYKAK